MNLISKHNWYNFPCFNVYYVIIFSKITYWQMQKKLTIPTSNKDKTWSYELIHHASKSTVIIFYSIIKMPRFIVLVVKNQAAPK